MARSGYHINSVPRAHDVCPPLPLTKYDGAGILQQIEKHTATPVRRHRSAGLCVDPSCYTLWGYSREPSSIPSLVTSRNMKKELANEDHQRVSVEGATNRRHSFFFQVFRRVDAADKERFFGRNPVLKCTAPLVSGNKRRLILTLNAYFSQITAVVNIRANKQIHD